MSTEDGIVENDPILFFFLSHICKVYLPISGTLSECCGLRTQFYTSVNAVYGTKLLLGYILVIMHFSKYPVL